MWHTLEGIRATVRTYGWPRLQQAMRCMISEQAREALASASHWLRMAQGWGAAGPRGRERVPASGGGAARRSAPPRCSSSRAAAARPAATPPCAGATASSSTRARPPAPADPTRSCRRSACACAGLCSWQHGARLSVHGVINSTARSAPLEPHCARLVSRAATSSRPTASPTPTSSSRPCSPSPISTTWSSRRTSTRRPSRSRRRSARGRPAAPPHALSMQLPTCWWLWAPPRCTGLLVSCSDAQRAEHLCLAGFWAPSGGRGAWRHPAARP